MPSFTPSQTCLLLSESSSYLLEVHSGGMTLSTLNNQMLFELHESILLAQGTIDDLQQIHLAYIKNSGELCYSVILPTGHHQTMTLGQLDIRNQRYDRLLLFPVGRVIHIFYASSHYGLPDVWRITHLFWNGQAWKSAQLGEVVHPRHPLYQVLMDSRSNLHILMMTYLGSRSALLYSLFNGTFYLWSKRQEVMSIPREVVDMTALITPQDEGHLFWAAKQPGSSRFEVGHGVQGKMYDFKSSWRADAPVASNLEGPWQGLGALQAQGMLSLLVHINQAAVFQYQDLSWKPVMAHKGDFSPLHMAQKSEGILSYTSWLRQEGQSGPLFARELSLGHLSSAQDENNAPLLDSTPFGEASPQTQSVEGTYTKAIVDKASHQATPDQPEQEGSLDQANLTESSSKVETASTGLLDSIASTGSSDSLASTELSDSLTSSAPITAPNSPPLSSELTTPPSDLDSLPDFSLSTVSQEIPEDQSPTQDLTLMFTDLKESTTSITSNLENLSEKVDSLPEVMELLKELKLKNEETLSALQQLEAKVNQIQTAKEVVSKKGFWQRWLT